MDSSLVEILKAESGKDDGLDASHGQSNQKSSSAESNTFALGETLKLLKERTGRKSFSLTELQDPHGTLDRHMASLRKDKPPAGGKG